MDVKVKLSNEGATEQRKSYQTPRLIMYGSVRELTTGGGGGSGESAATRVGFFDLPESDPLQNR